MPSSSYSGAALDARVPVPNPWWSPCPRRMYTVKSPIWLAVLMEGCEHRRMYTRAFVLRLPLHRSVPIAFWLVVGRLLGWKAPVPQVRERVIRCALSWSALCASLGPAHMLKPSQLPVRRSTSYWRGVLVTFLELAPSGRF